MRKLSDVYSCFFLLMLTSWMGWAGQKSISISKNLGFPSLPTTLTQNAGKSSHSSKVDSMLSQDWGLSHIGFFETFTPLIQPIRKGVPTCSHDVVVAVIDTGIDYTHPDLVESLWVNKGETGFWQGNVPNCHDKSCNGIDDDGNGFVDDVIGWDFVNNSSLPFDTHGHGTHISGIISAASANGVGISGVCPGASIMALKYYDSSGVGYNNLQNTVKAMQYAVKMGAQIINYSGGGSDPALAERLAVENADKKGILLVAAAGNDGHNNDYQPYYPASYPIDNIISVASINKQNYLLPSSNFGRTVQVAAPGLSVLSSLPGGRFGTMSGTSQATAFVTGAVALIASDLKTKGQPFEYKRVKRWINEGSFPLKGNDQKTLVSAGVLSIPGVLAAVSKDTVINPAITSTIAVVPKKSKNIQ